MQNWLKSLIFIISLSFVCGFLLTFANKNLQKVHRTSEKKIFCQRVCSVLKMKTNVPNLVFLNKFVMVITENGRISLTEFISKIDYNQKFMILSSDGLLILNLQGKGLWGDIRCLLAVDGKFEKIKGFLLYESHETPGLGNQFSKPQTADKFLNKSLHNFTITQNFSLNGENILHGISGATFTGTAIEKMINLAIPEYKKMINPAIPEYKKK